MLHEPVNKAVGSGRVLCREGDHYGVVLHQPVLLQGRHLEPGEHRLHHMELCALVHAGIAVTVGTLELPVLLYLSAAEQGALHRRLLELPEPSPELEPLALRSRARYAVLATARQGRKRGAITRLELEDRSQPLLRGLVDVETLISTLLKPPGISLMTWDRGGAPLPVVLRLTTHLENMQENDLISLAGCKGKWGKLEQLG